ncbi:AraC family transcriptional regulator [Prauserella marina]|uniref:Transcriptional regulator GlxA family, contains an amidase domain and an AraC-type DNA-binding HTH domain n=2 Tax=Prauserella marina TaxID=530584 RepID=A0A222VL14_9PSEU|nr:AraC family transcriptional regulator [Prauserella marina]PWV70556.1 AraC family transcriptional regulator with amidase-like domain [Prauserella marina]SDE02642.1 Transcriptional regulator GlxA family, contains an amidase domain and an AraC-type DNA-binding HTH domain [Prauserella marina]
MCKNPAMHQVVVLAIDEVIGYDMQIPPQIFNTARLSGERLYNVRLCGIDDKPVRVATGYTAVLDHGPDVLAEADTVIIPGTKARGPRYEGTLPGAIADALALIPGSARIMSICTGAFVLGAAGLLDERPATTHWAHSRQFRELYPRVKLDEDVLFVDDGDVLTSAGLAAGVDLCLHVVRKDHGAEVANAAARYCVVPPWREGGQSQFIERPFVETWAGSTAPTRAWALQHLAEPLDVAALACHASMSTRTFARRFREETGLPPHAWLTKQRVAHARRLLESTELSVEQVAVQSGLGSAASLRQHLGAAIGVTPLAYRRTFAAQRGKV